MHNPNGKITPASSLIVEDYLRKTLCNVDPGTKFNNFKSKLLPKNMESTFGDFNDGLEKPKDRY